MKPTTRFKKKKENNIKENIFVPFYQNLRPILLLISAAICDIFTDHIVDHLSNICEPTRN